MTEEQLSELLGASFAVKSSTDKTNSDYISYKDAQDKVKAFNDSIDKQLKVIKDFYESDKDINSDEKATIEAAIQKALDNQSSTPISVAKAANTSTSTVEQDVKDKINKYLVAYKKDLDKHIEELKGEGLWKEGQSVNPATLSQLLVLGSEDLKKKNVEITPLSSKVTSESGSVLNFLTHFYKVDVSSNDKKLKDPFLQVTYKGLKNSSYGTTKIKKIVVTYSNFVYSGNKYQGNKTPGIYVGDNPVDGFFYRNAKSVTMNIQLFGSDDTPITLDKNTAYITAESLNSTGSNKPYNKNLYGNTKYVEKATLLSKGSGVKLPESSVTVHPEKGHDVLYSDSNNEKVNASTGSKYSNWDSATDRSKAIYGSGLFEVSGSNIKIKYSNDLGSAWAPVSTTVPKLAFTRPSLKITLPNKLKLNKGEDTTEEDIRTRDVIDNFNNQEKVIGTQNVTLKRTKTVDSVAHKTTYSEWKVANNGYVTYTAPVHPGYTVNSINNQAISDANVINLENTQRSNKKDDPIIFNFTPDDQKAVVTYIDQNTGKILKVDSLGGHSDEKSGYTTKKTIDDYVKNQHYEFVSDETNGDEIVFDHNDDKDQSYEVILKHATEPASDTVTVKQTIQYIYANGDSASDDNVQGIDFKRSGIKDLVTNNIDWNSWNDGNYKTVDSPKIKGYTADKLSVEGTPVKATNNDTTIVVTYTPDPQQAMVEYLDDDANEKVIAQSPILKGVTGENSDYSTADTIDALKSEGYKLVSDDTKEGIVFDNDDNSDQVYYVHLKHDTVPVNPHTPDKDIPDTSDVKPEKLTESVTRTITYHYVDGHRADESTAPEYVNFEGSGTIDKVTGQLVELDKNHNIVKNSDGTIKEGKITWVKAGASKDSGTFSEEIPGVPDKGYSVTEIDGKKVDKNNADSKLIPSTTVKHDDPDIKVLVIYSPDAQQAMVEYLDDDANEKVIAQSPILKGVTGEKSDYSTADTIDALESEGYKLVSDDTEKGIIFDNDDNSDQIYYVHLKHDTMPVNPRTPDKDIPDTSDVKPKELTKSVTRTITYHYVDGHCADESTTPEVITFEGSGTIDKVTGQLVEVDKNHNIVKNSDGTIKEGTITWANKVTTKGEEPSDTGKFHAEIPISPLKGYSVIEIDGKKVDKNDTDSKLIPSATVSHTSDNIDVLVTYGPDSQAAMVEYLDDDANEEVIAQSPILKGVTNEKSTYSTADTIGALESEGYKLVSDDTKEGITFDNDDSSDQIYYVHMKHDTVPVNPRTPDKDIPDTSDVKPEELTKLVTRTITYRYADGHRADESTTPEVINFEGSGTIDKVTGKLVDLDENHNIIKNSDGTIKEGKITWVKKDTAKDEGKFYEEIPVSPVKGYSVTGVAVDGTSVDGTRIPAKTVEHTSDDIVVVVTYAPDSQQAMVEYVDDTEDSVISQQLLRGKTGEKNNYSTKSTIDGLVSEGYEFVSDGVPADGIVFDNDDSSDQIYYVHMKHGKKVVTPDPKQPEDPVDPNTPNNKTYGLTKTLSRDIYQIFNGEKKLLGTQSIDYTRKAIIDAVTKKQLTGDAVPATYEGISFNKDGYSKWTTDLAGYSKVNPTTFIGYTTHQGYTESDQGTNILLSAVDALNKANSENKNAEVDFTYAANPQQAMVEYVDDTEDSVISQQLLRGKTGEKNNYNTKSTIHDLTSEGYVLVSDGVPSDGIVFDNDDSSDQVYYVHLKHGIKEVDKDHPGKPDTPITPPDDPKDPHGPNYPKGSYEEDLTDDVTRTIKYVYSTTDGKGDNIPVIGKDGKPMVVTQTASFSAVGYLDTVTGKWVDKDGNEVEKGKELTWSPASAKLEAVISPVEVGYTVDQKEVGATTVKTGDKDQTVTVIYTPEVQKAHIKFVDDDSGENGTVLGTEDVDGYTDESIQFKNASNTLQQYLDNFDFVSLVDETPQITPKHSLMLFAATPYVANKSQQLLTTDAQKALTYNLGKFNNDSETDQQFVVHLKHHIEDGTRTRTVHQHVEYLYGEGDKKDTKLPANVAQDFDKDLTYSENGKVDMTYAAYQKGRSTNPIENKTTWDESTIKQVNFDTVNSPKVSGYHFDKDKVDPDDVTINNSNWNDGTLDVNDQVRYYANPQTAHIKFYDDTSKKFVKGDDGKDFEEVAKGKTGEEITLRNSLPRTRKALHSIMDENDHTLPYLPQFNMFDVSDTNNITDTSDSRKLADEGNVQNHIGNFDNNDDRSQLFIIHVKLPDPTPAPQPDPKPTPAPETHKITVTYKDDVTGETLDTESFTGKSGESANYSTTSTINAFKAKGYTSDPKDDETNGQPLTFSDNDQSYLVKLGHGTQEVTHHKTITRTIIGKTPNGDDINVKQPVTLTKVDTKDKVTGEITKQGTWDTGTWNKYDVPQFAGYTSQIEGKDGVQVTEKGVNSDTPDEVVHVSYVAIPSPDVPTPVPDTPPTTPNEDPQPNPQPSDPTSTPTQPSGEKKKVSQAPTPDIPKKKGAQPVVSNKVVTPAIKKSAKTVSVTEKVATHVAKATPSKKQATTETQNTLPQTGAKDENLAGMLGLMIASVGAIFGLAAGKKRKND